VEVSSPVIRRRCVLLAVVCLSVAACGGTGLPTPTTSSTAGLQTRTTVEGTRPSAAEPSASLPSRSSIALPTRSGEPAPTQDEPAPSRAAVQAGPTASIPGASPEQAPTSPSAQPSAVPPAPVDSSSPAAWPSWLSVLLVVLAVVAVVGTFVVARSRRARKAWRAQFDAVVAESTWLAHELVPDALSASGPVEPRSTWSAYRPRVDALRSVLDEAVASAPPDERDGASQLRLTVFEVDFAMDAYTAAVDGNGSRIAVDKARRRLEEALRAVQSGRDTNRSG
jgi:hypothetical protein